MLGVITPAQTEMKQHIEDFRAGVTRVAGGKFQAVTLDAFAEAPAMDTDIADALRAFVDRGRLERAAQIPASDLEVEDDGDEVRARVKDYKVLLDFPGKRIVHDCDDWSKRLVARQFCKHVAKLFLTMDRERAVERLDRIRAARSEWRFDVPSEY